VRENSTDRPGGGEKSSKWGRKGRNIPHNQTKKAKGNTSNQKGGTRGRDSYKEKWRFIIRGKKKCELPPEGERRVHLRKKKIRRETKRGKKSAA